MKKSMAKTSFQRLYPVTINLSTLNWYEVRPLLKVVRDPSLKFFDEEKSIELFKKSAKEVYLPLLEFIDQQNIRASVILPAEFVEKAFSYNKKLFLLLKKLVKEDQIKIVATAYYANSLTALYHSHWWADSVIKSLEKIENLLECKILTVYLPQLFRNLEIERLTHKFDTFLIRQKEGGFTHFNLQNSELRKFKGQTVSWVNEENNVNCHYYLVSNSLFFDINLVFLDKNRGQSLKAMAMKIGLASAKNYLGNNLNAKTLAQIPRIQEKYSLVLYNPLERATIRLWEYASILISSQYNNKPDSFSQNLFYQFAKLQNADFLIYLRKSIYLKGSIENFTSPYEAFINMQTTVKQIEILLKNRL